jgi:hypothetical protein
MGRPEIKVPKPPFVSGGDAELMCRECQLPCQLDETSIDCFRRFFLQGFIRCTYFVDGYCFLVDKPGCVFDNGGEHDKYWVNLLNEYYHLIEKGKLGDDHERRMHEFRALVTEQIENRQVSLCRYIEEYYNRTMETGGGLSEEMMGALDEAYMALLSGTSRKK